MVSFINPFFAVIMLMSILLGFLAYLLRIFFKRKVAGKEMKNEHNKANEQCLSGNGNGEEA